MRALLCSLLLLSCLAQAAPLSHDFMKGADLFSWQAADGSVRYSLLRGTNRMKTEQEILDSGLNLPELKRKLRALPRRSQIFWSNIKPVSLEISRLKLVKPEQQALQRVKIWSQANGLELVILED